VSSLVDWQGQLYVMLLLLALLPTNPSLAVRSRQCCCSAKHRRLRLLLVLVKMMLPAYGWLWAQQQ
jgi:hypothetical protein